MTQFLLPPTQPTHEVNPADRRMTGLLLQFVNNVHSVLNYAGKLLPITQEEDQQGLLRSLTSLGALSGIAEFKRVPEVIDLLKAQQAAGDWDLSGEPDLTALREKFGALTALVDQTSPELAQIFKSGRMNLSELLSMPAAESGHALLEASGFTFEGVDPTQFSMFTFADAFNTPNQTRILLETSLITLISMYENMLGDLLRVYFRTVPDAVPSDVRQLSLADLKAFGSIEAATDHVIEGEVDAFLRKNTEEWSTLLKNRFDVDLKALPVEWGRFVELYQRRNLIVHSDARVNRQYLNNVPEPYRRGVTLGTTLTVDLAYLQAAGELLLAQGLILLDRVWAKLARKGPAVRLAMMQVATSRLMHSGHWMALRLFLTEHVRDAKLDGAGRLQNTINLWLSIKRTDGLQAIHADLAKFDHSAIRPLFSAAVYALAEDFDGFAAVYPASELGPRQLREWPVFEELRRDERFASLAYGCIGDPPREVD